MKKKQILLIAYCLITSLFLFANDLEITKHIKMEVGEETIIRIPNLKGISNAGDTVEDVILSDGESVMLRGISWGDTLVTGWDDQGKKWIHKIHVEMPKYVKELKQFLHEIEGVNVNFLGKNIIVEGQLLRDSDIPKLNGILKNFSEVKNMVNQKTPKASDVLIESIKAELYNYIFKFSFLGEGLMYEGNVYTQTGAVKAKNIGQFYFDSTYPAITVVSPTIDFNCSILQLKNNNNSSKIVNYINKTKQKNEEDVIIAYPIFDSLNHDQAIDVVSKGSDSTSLYQHKFKGKSETENSILIEANDNSSLSMNILPKILNKRWIDTKITILLSSNNINIFKKSYRIVLRNGQGIALGNIITLIKKSIPKDKHHLLKELKTLSPFVNSDNNEQILLITPIFSLRS